MASLEDVLGVLAQIQLELAASKAETASLKAQIEKMQRNPFEVASGKTTAGTSGQAVPRADPPSVSVNIPIPIPLVAPERYSGDPNKVQIFLTQIMLHFTCKPAAFHTNQSKVAFMISYLSGDAASWAVPLVNNNDQILYDWDAFRAEFERVFDRRATTLCADKELLELQQGKGDLITYLSSFNRLIAETSWPEEKRLALYYKGLNDELKDVLAQIDPQPRTCTDLINLTLRLDHRLAERVGDRRYGDRAYTRIDRGRTADNGGVPCQEPMEIGSVKSPLTRSEKELRRRNGQCLYCGKKGHFVRDCPIRPQNRGPSGRFKKTSPASETGTGN